MAEFEDEDLSGSRFERVFFHDSRFRHVDFMNTQFDHVDLRGATLEGAVIANTRIDGHVESLLVNDVEVAAFVEAELDRREPLRVKMRPADAAGFREAWDILEGLWASTVERARTFDPDLLLTPGRRRWTVIDLVHNLQGGVQTFVVEGIRHESGPAPEQDDPPAETPPRSLDEVVALRRNAATAVRAVLDELTDASLDQRVRHDDGYGWPPARFRVRDCLERVVSAEWEARRNAEHLLDALEQPQ